jgi:signal recognition particle-docking protein FtsY
VFYLIVGVNGTGKTTTIAKIAARFQRQGRKVMLAAGDTFRAAGVEQLAVWAERLGAELVHHQSGGDPAAVMFDSIKAARARGIEVVIADTAGRLHTQRNLMEELRKVDRVVRRELGRAPDETLLVLDATTGQNALVQAQVFREAIGITGLVMTKLDGTAKGGTLITVSGELGLPVKLIGVGEKIEELRDFDAQEYAGELLPEDVYRRGAETQRKIGRLRRNGRPSADERRCTRIVVRRGRTRNGRGREVNPPALRVSPQRRKGRKERLGRRRSSCPTTCGRTAVRPYSCSISASNSRSSSVSDAV